jgi:hypothetical protein
VRYAKALTLAAAVVATSLMGGVAAHAAAPGFPSGTFVIGDGSAAVGSTVTFWGAMWATTNSVSGGVAPSAFKGAATTFAVDPVTCQGTFTSGPGNTHPVDAIPSDIQVLVTNSVTKSGPDISGTVVGMVVVHVDPGYNNDPGHAGTGTVVANACSISAS